MDVDKTALGVMDTSPDDPGFVSPDQKTQMISASSGNATQMAMNVECPVCRTANPPSETYCIDCGFLLSGAPVVVANDDGAGFAIPPPMGKLLTPDGTREFPLNPGANTVGRENADVLLAHNTVSRKHATITIEDGKTFVEDAGSTNGTYVDGKKLGPDEKVELTNGCDVVFGSFSLKYQAPAEIADARSPGVEGGGDDAPSADEKTEMIEPAAEPSEFDLEPAVESSEAPVSDDASEVETAGPVGRLVAKDGSSSFDIHDGVNTVGRRVDDNDIDIPDPYCSGRHADLTYEDGKFTITDIGSTNGTLVNGVKLDVNVPRELANGDEITLGRMVFRLEVA